MTWPTTPARFVLAEVDERGLRPGEDGELLSVSEYRGVVPRATSASQQAASEDTSRYKRCEPGQLVLNRLWAFRGGLGVSQHTGLVSPDYAVFDIAPDIDPRFIHHQTRSTWFVGEMTRRLRGIGSPDASNGRAPRINVGDLGRIEIFTPPLDVQQRTAGLLELETGRIDLLISKNRQVLDALAQRLQALVDASFPAVQREAIPLGYNALVLTSGIDKHSLEGQKDVRLCNYTDVYRLSEITDTSQFMRATCSQAEYDRLRLLPGDVVITKDSETADDIAIPAIVRADDDLLVLGYHNALLRPLDDRLDADYLYWYLQSRLARDHFAIRARGVTRVGLRVEDMCSLPVPTEPQNDQRQIVARLWDAQEQTRLLTGMVREQIRLLTVRRAALINAAVTGQLTV